MVEKQVSWWNNEVKKILKLRKTSLRKYKRTLDIEDYRTLTLARLKARKLLRYHKKKSWEEYVNTITSNTPPTKLFPKPRNLNGQNKSHDIPTIIENNQIIISKD